MTVEEFKELFEKEMQNDTFESRMHMMKWFLYSVADEEIFLGDHHFACVKIREQLMSKKLMVVQSDLLFIEREAKMPATFTMSVQSTVDSLEKDHMEYTNLRNFVCKEASKEDLAVVYAAMQFRAEYPHISNLLSLPYRTRNTEPKTMDMVFEDIQKAYPLEEVGELAIAI